MGIRRKHIRSTVEKLLKRHGVTDAPVPIEGIVKSLGIRLALDKVHNDLSGFLFRDQKDEQITIGANARHPVNRQRFTIAHELGHFLLHEGELVHVDERPGAAFAINLRDANSAKGLDPNEREANFFAAELLMPAKFLERDLRDFDLDLLQENDVVLKKLAKKYLVSVQALTFRLANLNYIDL